MREKGFTIGIMCLLLATTLFPMLPEGVVKAADAPGSSALGNTLWESEIAYVGTAPSDGVAVGEVFTDKPGSEVVFTSRDGWTYLSYYDEGQWVTEKILESQGQQLTPAIGDLRTDFPGNEILVVGLSSGTEEVDPGNGTATVLHWSGTQWVPETVFTDSALIHGCDIGDIDPTIPGNEALITTFSKRVVCVWYDTSKNEWNSSEVYKDGGNIRKVVIADILPERPGNEMVAVSKAGNATLAYGNNTNWTWKRIYIGDALARVCVGNIDPDPNLEVYLGSDTNKVIGLKREGDNWNPTTIFTDNNKNRGTWVADVDPNIPGAELYSFGYSRRLVQLIGGFSTGWTAKDLFLDSARGHEIRIGDIKSDTPGLEIAIVGYSGNLTIVTPSRWEFGIPFEGTAAIDGVAIGEVYPEKPGSETVFVSRDGWTYLSYFDEGEWKTEKILESQGQQLTPAIGDLRTDFPGNEILVVGLSSGTEEVDPGNGTATVLHRSGLLWVPETIFIDSALIHGCEIGDIDPTIRGNEALITTFSKRVVCVWYDTSKNEWNSSEVFKDGGNIRKVVIADILPERPGNEMVAVSKAGNATLAYGNNTNWTWKRIYIGDALARVCVGNIDPDANLEIYLGSDTNKVIGLKRDGDNWNPTTIFTDDNKNRGVWVADVDPAIDGPELYSFGYSRKLVQISNPFSPSREVKMLFMDAARGHEIRIGDLVPENAGLEIVIVGYSNNATVVGLREGGGISLPTITGPGTLSLASGSKGSVQLDVSWGGPFSLSAAAFPGVTAVVNPGTAMIKTKASLNVEATHTNTDLSGTVVVTVSYQGGTITKNVSVTVAGDKVVPTVIGVKNATGAVLAQDAKIDPEEVLVFTFSEPVTQASFDAAVDAGTLGVEWGGVARDAKITLSEDGRTVSIELAGLAPLGTVTVKIGGLKDVAGNSLADSTYTFEVEKKDDVEGNGLIIVAVLVTVFLIVLVVFILLMGRKKEEPKEEEEEEEKKEDEDVEGGKMEE